MVCVCVCVCVCGGGGGGGVNSLRLAIVVWTSDVTLYRGCLNSINTPLVRLNILLGPF